MGPETEQQKCSCWHPCPVDCLWSLWLAMEKRATEVMPTGAMAGAVSSCDPFKPVKLQIPLVYAFSAQTKLPRKEAVIS